MASAGRVLRDVVSDLSQLPVQTCWPDDAGPLITWPVVVTRPPGSDDPAGYNLGIYRMQVLDRDRAIMRWLPMRGGAAHHRQWAAIGADLLHVRGEGMARRLALDQGDAGAFPDRRKTGGVASVCLSRRRWRRAPTRRCPGNLEKYPRLGHNLRTHRKCATVSYAAG